jgi:hypothetical protein
MYRLVLTPQVQEDGNRTRDINDRKQHQKSTDYLNSIKKHHDQSELEL